MSMVAVILIIVLVIVIVLCLIGLVASGGSSSEQAAPSVDQQMQNAIAAGWNPADGKPPHDDHGTPPAIDPKLGNNGIPPTDAKRIA